MTHASGAGLQAAFADLAIWPRTTTGRRSYMTARRRPLDERPRIARRFVPRHSLAITLDADLCQGARNCLSYLLSLPRKGLVVHTSAGQVAHAFGVSDRTARRWLLALDDQGYLARMPGQRRGQLVLLLAPKASRWCQLRQGDLQPRSEKKKQPNQQLAKVSRGLPQDWGSATEDRYAPACFSR
jgi:hypothetical protein